MEIFQLKLEGFYTKPISQNLITKVLNKNKVQFEDTNSGKSVFFPKQTVISTDEASLYNIAMVLMADESDLHMCRERGILTIKPLEYMKLIIEHSIVLDLYDDIDEEELTEFSDYLTDLCVFHKVENGIITISDQKCRLEYEYINDIIFHIMCGSTPESHLSVGCRGVYYIAQRTGYEKYLK